MTDVYAHITEVDSALLEDIAESNKENSSVI